MLAMATALFFKIVFCVNIQIDGVGTTIDTNCDGHYTDGERTIKMPQILAQVV